ncbi:MAG: DNA mismatch repair protein MutS [Candidatus Aminicenantes bacterium]|nr:DNA mismatch repair protein MutS [Candidatus Aminicenantes bacterium]
MESIASTPMLRQYLEIKKSYPDAILFFRLGDFYEMFFDDAKTAAPILEVVLTSRNKSKEDAVPLCGVPHHAWENYAAKLLRRGFKVAICEQVEDPALAKGLVRREVTHILTPATALEVEALNSGQSNFIAVIRRQGPALALASLDLAVSDFEVKTFASGDEEALVNELYRKFPKEIIVAAKYENEFRALTKRFPEFGDITVTVYADAEFNAVDSAQVLKHQFNLASSEGLGLDDHPAAMAAAGVMIKYLRSIRRGSLAHLSPPRFNAKEDYLVLDAVSFRNLEIVLNLRSGTATGSLFGAVDFTVTPMGRRLLHKWLSYPLLDRGKIELRLDGVEEFSQNLIGRSEVRKQLKYFADLARLNSKIALNIALPQHLLNLGDTLQKIPGLKGIITDFRAGLVCDVRDRLQPLPELVALIDKTIAAEPANTIHAGQIIKQGYNQELDELRAISHNAKEIVSAMEKSEKAKTGIPSLKIKYNKVFGYFIEVTNSHLKLVPENYIRKQTLVNAERFLTAELKELEDKILKAEERIVVIEEKLYLEVLAELQRFSGQLNLDAELIALLDVLSAWGELAQRRSYVRPEVNDGMAIRIQDGRHPVIETAAGRGFIPNDLEMASESDQILIITGPNMGGKSTYLRQNTLIVILAQAGCFVPASKAQIGICDRVFTRIGASDSLIEGKSTFLIEMIEAAIILNNASARSLILLDEIGRGTSTYDGLSIAWAVVEFLHGLKERPRTLFATHYHELTELASILARVKNYHIAVKEWQDNVIFLHKIMPGPTDQSFGIHVAKIAGIPKPVIERAKEILLNLEKKELNRLVKERITGKIEKMPAVEAGLFPEDMELKVWDEIRDKLKEIDIARLTPLEALNILQFLKAKSDKFQ